MIERWDMEYYRVFYYPTAVVVARCKSRHCGGSRMTCRRSVVRPWSTAGLRIFRCAHFYGEGIDRFLSKIYRI